MSRLHWLSDRQSRHFRAECCQCTPLGVVHHLFRQGPKPAVSTIICFARVPSLQCQQSFVSPGSQACSVNSHLFRQGPKPAVSTICVLELSIKSSFSKHPLLVCTAAARLHIPSTSPSTPTPYASSSETSDKKINPNKIKQGVWKYYDGEEDNV